MRTAPAVQMRRRRAVQAVRSRALDEALPVGRPGECPDRLAVFRHVRIGIDDGLDQRGLLVRRAGDDHASIRMAGEHGLRLARAKGFHHLVDVPLEIGSARRLVAEPRESERLDVMAFAQKRIADRVECPASVPATWHQDESCHRVSSRMRPRQVRPGPLWLEDLPGAIRRTQAGTAPDAFRQSPRALLPLPRCRTAPRLQPT